MLKTLKKIKEEGWEALVERLGIADATMFVMEHERGYGDYTGERKKIFDQKTLDEIVNDIKELMSNHGVKRSASISKTNMMSISSPSLYNGIGKFLRNPALMNSGMSVSERILMPLTRINRKNF